MASKKAMTFRPGMTTKGSLNKDGDAINTIAAKNLYNFQYIDKDKIYPNEKNGRFDQVDIESLRESITRIGLQHNLVVIKEKDKDKYRLVSGERRWHAISMMEPEEYKKAFPAGIPCKVQSDKITDIDEEIALISANTEQRARSVEDNLNDVRRLVELYEAKKDKGEIKSVPKFIAEKIGVTERQARKYINVGNLIPELESAFKEKELSLEDANRFASLGEHEQTLLAEILSTEGEITQDDYDTIKKVSDETRKKAEQAESELQKANEQLAAQDAQIEKLKELLEQSKMMAQKTAPIENVIRKTEEKKEALTEKRDSLAKQNQEIVGMSRKELAEARKKTRMEKIIDNLESSVSSVEKMWENIEKDPELAARFMVIAERVNLLNGRE